ncbi:hypothetical protein BKA56DRAFT_550355 [Ilyonectria sp. MPI-CAGE-AT-0026]|nr:hypothetical protein BKA56DRAFT_550355 [Ilyonectria sp. MPI-CAGE-AT-0026]
MRVNPYNLAVVLFTALGSYTYGFNSSIIASATGLESFWSFFNLSREGPNAAWSTQMIGASAFTTGSANIAMFLVGRGLQGIGAGMIDTICPLYQSEVSPAHARGEMVGMHAVFLVAGYAGASWIGLGCYFEDNPDIQWRLCIAFQMLAPSILLLGSSWLPESPRYLIYHGRLDEGLQVLKKLHSNKNDTTHDLASDEFTEIKRQIELDREHELSWIDLWKKPNTRKRLLCGFLAIAIAQSSGVLVINNYQIVLYQGLGITGWRALLLLSVYTSWACFMNWVNAMLLDRLGRTRMMVIGMYANWKLSVYLAEIFPTWMRAEGVSFSVAGLFTTTLIYTGSASVAFAGVGWKYYLVFIFVPLAGVAVIWFWFPETNGLTLEEIGVLFGDEITHEVHFSHGHKIDGIEVAPARPDDDVVESKDKTLSQTV